MVVHHVKVDEVGAGGYDTFHFIAKTRKIGGQYAGRDAIHVIMGLVNWSALFYPQFPHMTETRRHAATIENGADRARSIADKI
jgi:hypothetical protein